ncbi:MAG: peptidyl-prolyl cis-trans isomerase [Gammaproteobacteria bacterium]|nr:peptidyl-prolyl cis-trans isomerase [Gammaproteobacteria bacterium]
MRWLRDPLLFFLLVGAGLFIVANTFSDDDISYHVEVTQADLNRLTDQWSMQMRRPPTTQELTGLLEQFVKEEIYYREARRIGLETNDTIVRRRLVQKLTFLTEDIATATPQDEASLNQYYQTNVDNYHLPLRISFRHRYFSSDRRDSTDNPDAAQQAAIQAVTDLDRQGDAFMLQKVFALRSQREVGDLFGRSFAAQLINLQPQEDWQGPIKSAYGWHAIQITAREPARIQSFDQVRDRVIADAQQASREQANRAYYADLRLKYDISYPTETNDANQ